MHYNNLNFICWHYQYPNLANSMEEHVHFDSTPSPCRSIFRFYKPSSNPFQSLTTPTTLSFLVLYYLPSVLATTRHLFFFIFPSLQPPFHFVAFFHPNICLLFACLLGASVLLLVCAETNSVIQQLSNVSIHL